MAVPFIQTSFAQGEISPSLFGHVDLAKFHSAAATERNMFVSYRGGAYSRAGTALVGISKQTGRAYPPRLITFQFSINQGLALEFGNKYMRVVQNGALVTEPNIYNITNVSAANPGVVTTATPHGFAEGDWVYVTQIVGMPGLNTGTFVVHNPTTFTFALHDVYGNGIDTSLYGIYVSDGEVSRIFTMVTPWAEADLAYMKFTESANTMSICCVNQITKTEYPQADLVRGANNYTWILANVSPLDVIAPPAAIIGSATATTMTKPTTYQYVATVTDLVTGQESVASPIVTISDSVDISSTAGALQIECQLVVGGAFYRFYKALPAYNVTSVPQGGLFGYAGMSYGPTFIDTNITADYSTVPPIHTDPFAPGQIIAVNVTTPGANLLTCTASITTTTGSGFSGYSVIDGGGALVGFVVTSTGQHYAPGDTVTFNCTFASGSTAPTGTLSVGPLTGTFPSLVAYFQERRVYGASLNNPDTYWMSQPGAFLNFDTRTPTIASDAITGTPWSVQVNGLQWFVSMPGGLVVLTGQGAWQVTGAGGSSLSPQPITPSTQQAQPQAYNGASPTVPPIKISYELLYVQSKGSTVRDLSYNFFANIYTGTDLTQFSSHLFIGRTIKEWAWCEEPYKVVWAVRDDGTLLSLTFLKEQEISGWARHDTFGLFSSVCSVTEPPVDALYCAVQRFPQAQPTYFIERMDNRIWQSVEDTWCVDCGVRLLQPTRNAVLTATSANGIGKLVGVTNLAGGSNYSNETTIAVIDNNGQGTGVGAIPTITIVAGAVTAIGFSVGGSNYINPRLVITDPTGMGTGASASCVLDNSTIFVANAPVFTVDDVGSVIRCAGGIAVVTGFISSTQLTANLVSPITSVVGFQRIVVPQLAGTWTITKPVTTVYGLNHITGMAVVGLADGQVIPPTIVSQTGTLDLPFAASSVTLGLPFEAQLQSVYVDAGQPTIQGQRKRISLVTARLESSRGISMGANQVDGSTLSPQQNVVNWTDMTDVRDADMAPPYGTLQIPYANTTAPLAGGTATPLYTGDVRIPVGGGFAKAGQVALQQTNPLPMNVLALIPELTGGDDPQIGLKPKKGHE